MSDALMKLFSDPYFWLRVLVSCLLWYGLGCLLANVSYSNGEDPRHAAKSGGWISLMLTGLITGFGSWFWWQNSLLSASLGVITLLLSALVLLILSSQESAPEQ